MLRTLKNIATAASGAPEAMGAVPPITIQPTSKIATVIAMLERPDGATLTDLAEATGWLPHTIRAALTRLRQKGHRIDKANRDGVTVYTVAKSA